MVAIEAIEGGASFVDRFGKLAIFVLQNDPGCLFLIKKSWMSFMEYMHNWFIVLDFRILEC